MFIGTWIVSVVFGSPISIISVSVHLYFFRWSLAIFGLHLSTSTWFITLSNLNWAHRVVQSENITDRCIWTSIILGSNILHLARSFGIMVPCGFQTWLVCTARQTLLTLIGSVAWWHLRIALVNVMKTVLNRADLELYRSTEWSALRFVSSWYSLNDVYLTALNQNYTIGVLGCRISDENISFLCATQILKVDWRSSFTMC